MSVCVVCVRVYGGMDRVCGAHNNVWVNQGVLHSSTVLWRGWTSMQPLTSGNPNQTPQVHALSVSLARSMAPLNTNTCTHADHSHQTITSFEIKQVFLQINHSFDDILNFYGVWEIERENIKKTIHNNAQDANKTEYNETEKKVFFLCDDIKFRQYFYGLKRELSICVFFKALAFKAKMFKANQMKNDTEKIAWIRWA